MGAQGIFVWGSKRGGGANLGNISSNIFLLCRRKASGISDEFYLTPITERRILLLLYHNHFMTLWILSGTIQVSWYQKGKAKTNLDFLEQEIVSGSGISWAICKSAPRPRQITTPAPYHSVFLQAGCPSCRPTNSVKALKAI